MGAMMGDKANVERRPSRWDQFYSALGERLHHRLYLEVSARPTAAPRLTLAKLLCYLFAAGVYAFALLAFVLGLWLIWHEFNLFGLVLGGLCLSMAGLARPRFPRLHGKLRPRTQLPILYAIVDRVAQALGVRPVDGIVIDEQFAAGYARVGWRQKRMLHLGLPLFAVLSEREKIALIAHELAHEANGDPQRSFIIGSAFNALLDWHDVLRPRLLDRTEGCFVATSGCFQVPANLFLLAVSQIPWAAMYVLSHLMWRDSQRAEYLADHRATQVAGTQAAQILLTKVHFGHYLPPIISSAALGTAKRQPNIFDELRRRLPDSAAPANAIFGAEREAALRVDTTHPPTSYRLQYIRTLPAVEPSVTISAAEVQRLEEELAELKAEIQSRLIDQYVAHLDP